MPAGIGTVVGSAWLKVGVDPAGVTRGSNLAGKSLIGLGNIGGKTLAVLMRFAGAYIGFTALTKAISGSAKAFINFNEALRESHTLQDLTWKGMQAIGEEVRSLARDFPDMSTVAQQAMYEINSAVFFGSEALSILETSLKGASAGITDVQTTADVLTTVLNAFNMSGYEANKVMDLFFTTIKIGKTRLPELTGQFGRLAGIAGPVGSSISDLTAAISFLTRRGLETRWAITALRQTFMQIIKPTRHLKDALSALGYVSGSTMIREKGFAESLKSIVGWAGSAGIKVDQLFTNIRAVMAVLPLASSLTGKKGYAWDLEQMANSAGAAQVAFEKMEKSWAFQLNRLKSLFNDLGITIGETFVPSLRAIVDVGTAAANALRPLVKLFDTLGGGYFIAIAGGIGVLTGSIWLLHKAYIALTAVLGAFTVTAATAAATTGALATMTAGGLATALAGGISMGFAPAAIISRMTMKGILQKGLLAVKGVLQRVGIGKLLGAGAGISLGVKGLIDFDLELGEISGIESVKSGLFDAFKTILGGTIAGALLGHPILGAVVAGGALVIKIILQVAEARGTALEGAMAAARESVISFPGISLLKEQLTGATGLEAYARQLVLASGEIKNTTLNFEAMTNVLRDSYTAITKLTLFGPVITGWSRATLDAFEGQELLTRTIGVLTTTTQGATEILGGVGLTGGISDLSLAMRDLQGRRFPVLSDQTIVLPEPTIAGVLPTELPPAIERTTRALELATRRFNSIQQVLRDGNITLEDSVAMWGELATMQKTWTTAAEISAAAGGEWTELFKAFAVTIEAYIAGGEGLDATRQAVQDLYAEYKRLAIAYQGATEGSLEQAMALEGLTGIYSSLITYQENMGLETEELNSKWREMLEWLGSIGIEISKITMSDFTDQIALYEKALAEAVESGNTAAIISNLSGLESIYVILNNEIEKLRDTEYAYLIDVLKPLIAALEEAHGFKIPTTPDVKTSWWTPISQAADMIVAGAGQLVNAFKSAIDAFNIEDWAGVTSGVIGMIQSIVSIWLREEKERLEERKKQLEEEKRLQEEMLGFWKESLTGLISSFGSILSTGLGDILGPLAGVVDTLSNAFSKAVEMTFLDGIDLLRAGMELFNSLITGLVSSFMNLFKQADAYSALQKETSSLWKAVADLFGMFLWPLVAVIKALKGLLGIVDETSQELASLNVPVGFKMERIRYAAITPGIPAIGAGASAVPAWAVAVGDELAGAIMRMLERFGISDWTSLLESFKQGSIDFWNYVTANVPAIIDSLTGIFDIFRNAFGDISVSTIVDLLKSVVDWFINDAPAFAAQAVEFFTKLKDFADDVMTWMGKVDWDQLMTDISTAFSGFNTLLKNLPTWTDIKAEIGKLITAIGKVETAITGVESVGHTVTNIAGGAAAGAAIGTWLLPGIGTLGGAIAGGAIGWIASLLGFAEGGIVPGPIGAPQLAVVHGGETITPPPGAFMSSGGGGDLHVHMHVNSKEVAHEIIDDFRDISYRKIGRSYSGVAINGR